MMTPKNTYLLHILIIFFRRLIFISLNQNSLRSFSVPRQLPHTGEAAVHDTLTSGPTNQDIFPFLSKHQGY